MIRGLGLGEPDDINALLDRRKRDAEERERAGEQRRRAAESGEEAAAMGHSDTGQRAPWEKFALGFLGTLLVGTLGWYVADQVQEVRIADHERRIVALEPLPQQVVRQDEQLKNLLEAVRRIEKKLDDALAHETSARSRRRD